MKKVIFSVIILILTFSLAACGSGQKDQSDAAETVSESPAENSVSFSDDFVIPTIEPMELANREGIIITANELVYDLTEGWGLSVTIENHSYNDITVQPDHLAVNHFDIIRSYFHDVFEVDSGQIVTGTFYFNYGFEEPSLDSLNMTAITDIEISFYVLKTWQLPGDPRVNNEELFISDLAEIHTSEYRNGPQTASISGGIEVYNQNGIRLTAKCIRYDSEEYALDAMIFVDNQSDGHVFVRSEGVYINQSSFISGMRCDADPGYTAISLQRIYNIELSNDDISEPLSFNTSFSILDEYEGNILDQTDSFDIPLETE